MQGPISEVFFTHEAFRREFQVCITVLGEKTYGFGSETAIDAGQSVGMSNILAPHVARGLLAGIKELFPAMGATEQAKEEKTVGPFKDFIEELTTTSLGH